MTFTTIGQMLLRSFSDPDNAIRVLATLSGGTAGTEYTEGALDATITGPAIMTEGPSNTLQPAQSNAAKELLIHDTDVLAKLVEILAAVDGLEGFTDGLEGSLTSILAAVDGLEGFTDGLESSLTSILAAVDGLEGFTDGLEGFVDGLEGLITTLNAKDFATETTLLTIKTAVEIMDDWDESDRAKVNPIVGSAGVQGGSGAVSTNTQRVVLATDVALPTGTNAIGKVGHDTTAVADGRTAVTTAGTRVALAASTSCKWVIITAETDNTGLIVVGGASTVVASLATRRGTPLYPGDSVTLLTDNLADIGLDSTVSTDGVTYEYGT